MLLNKHKDILLKLLAGKSEHIPNYLYLEYANTASNAVSTITSSDDILYFMGLPVSKNFIRIPVVIEPSVDDDSILYSAFFSTDSEHGELDQNVEYSSINASKIYAISLVSGIDPDDFTKDVPIAYETLDTPLVASTNQQLAVQFTLTLN